MRGGVCPSPPRGRARGPEDGLSQPFQLLAFSRFPDSSPAAPELAPPPRPLCPSTCPPLSGTLLLLRLNWRREPYLPSSCKASQTQPPLPATLAESGQLSKPLAYQQLLILCSCAQQSGLSSHFTLLGHPHRMRSEGPFQYLWCVDPCIRRPRPHYQNEDLGPQWVNSSNPSLAMISSNNK